MQLLKKGRFTARFAETRQDIAAAQILRQQCFFGGVGAGFPDCDRFDSLCRHVLIEELATGDLVCCFRILDLCNGGDINRSYSAQFYGLSLLAGYSGRMIEMGRFCIRPGAADADILRIAWGALTRYVNENKVEMLFGCTSFQGVDTQIHLDAFALLKARHLAPGRWLPRVKAPEVFRFAQKLRGKVDARKAMMRMPPLLRTYLTMGGWVSDHAVVDSQMNTLHVFTGLEIRAIPPARQRLLRLLAA